MAEEFWTYRDAELFRAVWGVLVTSWFGWRWRALLAKLADTHILPKNLWSFWARHIAWGRQILPATRRGVHFQPPRPHGRACPRTDDRSAPQHNWLVQGLCDFPSLVRHRALFIDAGAIDLLVHHIRQIQSPSCSTFQLQENKGHDITKRQSQTLARLLTEAETSDNRTVQFNIGNVPVLWDFRLR